MRSILLLLRSNLRHDVGQSISLFVFAFIGGLLLNLGLLLMLCFGSFFDERSAELDAAHFVFIEEESLFLPDHINYLESYPEVTSVELESAMFFTANVVFNDGEMLATLLIQSEAQVGSMSRLTLIEGNKPIGNDEICLPYVYKTGGYNLGDKFVISNPDYEKSYTVCGFSEEIMFGSIYNQVHRLYLSDAGYNSLLDRIGQLHNVISAQITDTKLAATLNQDFYKEFFFSSIYEDNVYLSALAMDYSDAKFSRTYMSSITSAVLIMFAVIIVLIAVLMIRFRIRNTIDENIGDIGSLKAVGYTGKQQMTAMMFQFMGLSLLGVLAGIASSYAILPQISQILELQTAMQWNQGFDLISGLIVAGIILLIVFTVSWLSARGLLSLSPLKALRQGFSTHSFKRNHFSLEKTRGPLLVILALKGIVQSKGQEIMSFLIMMSLSFVAIAGISVYDNLGTRSDSFAQLLFGEVPDASIFATTPQNAIKIRDIFESDARVEKVVFSQDYIVMIEDIRVSNRVVDDFSLLEGTLVYEGRYPKHDNEIVLSGSVASLCKLQTGDMVKVSRGTYTREYLIVGLIQTVNRGGMASAMTSEAYLRVQPSYEPQQLIVYLHDNSQTSSFVEQTNNKHGELLLSSLDYKRALEVQLVTYSDIFFWVAVIIAVVTVLLVFLMLYLMLETLILQRWREIGIQKVLGYTNFELMHQQILSFMPAIALGVICGAVLGALGFNQIFVMVTSSMGINTASMPAPILLTVITSALLILLAYAFATLITLRICKVSAYVLITE